MSASTRHNGAGAIAPRAVIDIGSNTVRLVVYGGPPRAPAILHNEKITAKLGKGMAETGLLSPKARKAALAALARYVALLELTGVEDVRTVATAAVRDARNGGEFLDEVRAVGLSPRLLSGEEEALVSARGVAWAFPGAQGIVADLGGGSLELTDISGHECSHGVSLPLGTLRLAALREPGDKVFARTVSDMLSGVAWQAEPGVTLYLVGGSLRALARHAMLESDWPIDDPHGFALPAEEALRLARAVIRKPPLHPLNVPGLSASRLASLPDAAALLIVLIEQLQPARLVFSSWGLREGVLFDGAAAHSAALDPLIAGVSDFVERGGVEPAVAAMVASWTLAANDPDGAGNEPLRLAATMLCLASSRVEPNLRPNHALDWALRKRWIGISSEQRAMLAAAILANAGRAEASGSLSRLASPEQLREAHGWGLATRLCRRFSWGMAAGLAGTSLMREDGNLVLRTPPQLAPLVNEGVERDLKAVALHLGLKPVLQRQK